MGTVPTGGGVADLPPEALHGSGSSRAAAAAGRPPPAGPRGRPPRSGPRGDAVGRHGASARGARCAAPAWASRCSLATGRRRAAGVGVTIGARSAAWAPVRDPAVVVVLDEHDEGLQGGAGADLARPRRGDRAGPTGRRPVSCSCRRARPSRRWRGRRSSRRVGTPNGRGGRPSRSSTCARRLTPRAPASIPMHSCACCAPIRGWCACSTARAGLDCSRASRAVSWPRASGVVPRSRNRAPTSSARGAATGAATGVPALPRGAIHATSGPV